MSSDAPEPTDPARNEEQAGRLPSGRLARTARVGGLAAGQGLRWAGMRTANRVRSPERAQAATNERTVNLVNELVDQLSQMRGAAMKVGQMLSMAEIEFDELPPEQSDELKARLAALRDDIPPVAFPKLEKMMRKELGGPLNQVFAEFDERAFAAASIGQVHRATTRDGREVVVKVQYPGVAEAVETDMRNAMLLLPLIRRLAPSIDGRALAEELRERITEELDYELEAQNQRRIERLRRGHPFITIPAVDTELSTRRVLVSEYIEGQRFEAVRQADEVTRDRYAEITLRFYFGLLYRDRIALGDPHPGNQLLRSDSRVGFLDFGLMRDMSATRITAESGAARAARDEDPAGLVTALRAGGYLTEAGVEHLDAERTLEMMRRATRWYAIPGFHRFGGIRPRSDREQAADPSADAGAPDATAAPSRRERRERAGGPSGAFTLPPETILIRRTHVIVAATLRQLRAGADWGAIAAEYLHGDPPSTPLGEAEAEWAGSAR